MLLWLYDGSTISIYRVFNRIGCRLWVRYKGLLRCPHTPGVQMPAELGYLYFMSIEAWKCPYSIIRTNRKSFAAQRVDWLITIPAGNRLVGYILEFTPESAQAVCVALLRPRGISLTLLYSYPPDTIASPSPCW